MNIDRDIFFEGYRAVFGPLESLQVDGLSFLLGKLEQDTLETIDTTDNNR